MTRPRRWAAAIGAPARAVLIGGIRVYRATLSGWLGGQCRFYPSCSQYGETAVRTHGAVKGTAMALWRIARCNPFGSGGLDPVPDAHTRHGRQYDAVIPSREAHA